MTNTQSYSLYALLAFDSYSRGNALTFEGM